MQTDFFARNTFNVTDLTLDRPWTTASSGQKGTQATQRIFLQEKAIDLTIDFFLQKDASTAISSNVVDEKMHKCK